MTPRRTAVAVLLAAFGLVVRLWALPLWGTFDTEVQKAWSARAVTAGLADIYGPPDHEILRQARERSGWLPLRLATMPLPRTIFEWGGGTWVVDYPPGSILVLWTAGKLYQALRPELPNRQLFNALINLAPLLGAAAIAVLLRRSAPGEETGWRRALAFWLNPAVLLAAPVLGYQDTIFGAFALGGLLALMARRHVASAALTAVAGLVKPQGALLLPVVVVVTLRESSPRVWARAAFTGAAAAALILLPWWSQGHLISALDGCRRPLTQTTLAPLGLNVWWIAGYVMDWSRQGPWPLARIVPIDVFRDWAGWDPRAVSRALLAGATLGILALLLRRLREDRRVIPLAVILEVHAYALLGTSVHENHTFLAVILAPLLVGAWPRGGALVGLTSAFLFANLFLMYGLGRRITRQAFLLDLRSATALDLSVVVAIAHVALVVLLFVWVFRPGRAR